MSRLFVFSPNGAVGSKVAEQLAQKGIHFKAGVHSAAKGEELKKKYGDKVEPVVVDFYDPATLDAALKGIEKVFLCTPGGQTIVPVQNVGAAAKKNGVKHIVKLSALGTEHPDKSMYGAEHAESEEELNKLGLAVTSIRPSCFYSNFLLYDTHTIKPMKKIFKAMADAKSNFVDNGDIAAAIVATLTTPGHENKKYYITGPENFTYQQIAQLFSEALGEQIQYVPLDDATLRERAKNYLPSQDAIEAYANLFQFFRDGYYDVKVTDLEKLTGSKGKPLKVWIQENVAAFK